MSTQQFRSLLKAILPPVLVSLYKRPKQDYGFFGDYASWEEALAISTGYDSEVILNKVKNALLQVRDGKAAYERDSVLFDHIEYSFPILAALLKVALENNGKLSVLDFGGSLGSSYYQYKDILSCVHTLEWSIVEQPKFVECGREFFQDETLKFFYSIDECLKSRQQPQIILFSSVLQYLQNPLELIQDISAREFSYVVIDRSLATPIGNRSVLTIHKVNPEIYSAIIPTWLICDQEMIDILNKKYDLIYKSSSYASGIQWDNQSIEEKSFFFKQKTSN
jgi:putative methyltransferase (TIGR04325 family)